MIKDLSGRRRRRRRRCPLAHCCLYSRRSKRDCDILVGRPFAVRASVSYVSEF